MSAGSGLDRRAADLRAEFDDVFARPSGQVATATEDLLAVRIAGDPYALRMSELTGLLANGTVVPLPGRRPELAGIAGVRGALVAVYNLSSLLGYGVRVGALRWLALCGTTESVALAFDDLEGFLRVPRESLYRVEGSAASRPYLAEVARVGSGTFGVIDTRSILKMAVVVPGRSGAR